MKERIYFEYDNEYMSEFIQKGYAYNEKNHSYYYDKKIRLDNTEYILRAVYGKSFCVQRAENNQPTNVLFNYTNILVLNSNYKCLSHEKAEDILNKYKDNPEVSEFVDKYNQIIKGLNFNKYSIFGEYKYEIFQLLVWLYLLCDSKINIPLKLSKIENGKMKLPRINIDHILEYHPDFTNEEKEKLIKQIRKKYSFNIENDHIVFAKNNVCVYDKIYSIFSNNDKAKNIHIECYGDDDMNYYQRMTTNSYSISSMSYTNSDNMSVYDSIWNVFDDISYYKKSSSLNKYIHIAYYNAEDNEMLKHQIYATLPDGFIGIRNKKILYDANALKTSIQGLSFLRYYGYINKNIEINMADDNTASVIFYRSCIAFIAEMNIGKNKDNIKDGELSKFWITVKIPYPNYYCKYDQHIEQLYGIPIKLTDVIYSVVNYMKQIKINNDYLNYDLYTDNIHLNNTINDPDYSGNPDKLFRINICDEDNDDEEERITNG